MDTRTVSIRIVLARWIAAGVCLLVCGINLSVAQGPSRSAPVSDGRPPLAKAEIQYVSRQSLEKGVTLARISNGMTVIVQENHSAPVATVRCYIHNTGSAYEGKYLGAGLSHMLEHLVAGGTTTKRTYDQIREIVDSLGGQTNAYTSDDVTAFYIDCPAANVNVAIELTAQNMQFSVIPENEYKREWGVVQRELEMGEADRERVLYNAMKKLVYQEHPARHPTIGYLSVVQQVSRQDVIDFYKSRYVPQNMTFVVVGDVETDAVLADVLALFKTFQRTTERGEMLPVEPEQASPRSTRIEMEGETVHLALAWPTVALQHADLYPLDTASHILTNGDSSRLVKRLKIEEPLVVSVSSASYTPGFVKGWFEISAECKPKHSDKVRQIILAEVERLKTEPVSSAELAKAKRQKAADHVFSQQTVENQAETLASSYRSTGDPLFDTQYVAGIQKVTAAEIQQAARAYFRSDRLNTVQIEPIGSGAKEDQKRGAGKAETPVVKKQLPNGLTVLLKRQSALPMVTIQAYVKAGSISDAPAKSGLASLTTEMLEKGTKKYTAEQIAGYFDSIGGTLLLDSKQNTSYVQCSVLAEDAKPALDYVYEVLFQPTFPADEFENVQQIRLARIAGRKANPQTEIMDFWAKQLPATSPYSRTALGDAGAVAKLTPGDCRQFHAAYFVPNNMVLAVFGDVDPEATLKQIEGSFGKRPRAESFQWPVFPEQPLLKADSAGHLQNQKKETAMVLLSFPTVGIRDEKTRATLEMLDGLLTGGGSAGGLLHEELRGQQLVYYIFGMQMTGFAPGYFNFLAQARPESAAEVISRVRANLDKIRKEGVSDEEFEKTRKKLIVAHTMRNTTPSERAFQASIDELYGLGFDYEQSYAERLGKVTVKDLVAVVNKYFEHGLTVTSSPEAAPKAATKPGVSRTP